MWFLFFFEVSCALNSLGNTETGNWEPTVSCLMVPPSLNLTEFVPSACLEGPPKPRMEVLSHPENQSLGFRKDIWFTARDMFSPVSFLFGPSLAILGLVEKPKKTHPSMILVTLTTNHQYQRKNVGTLVSSPGVHAWHTVAPWLRWWPLPLGCPLPDTRKWVKLVMVYFCFWPTLCIFRERKYERYIYIYVCVSVSVSGRYMNGDPEFRWMDAIPNQNYRFLISDLTFEIGIYGPP